jgi:hypothetical protein
MMIIISYVFMGIGFFFGFGAPGPYSGVDQYSLNYTAFRYPIPWAQ